MKLWKLAPIAALATLATLAGVACTRPSEDDNQRTGSAQAIERTTIDGAYMKIFGGKQSYFVFHTSPTGSDTGNTFFAEFEGPDGKMIRADGIFSYGHDDLGNYVELKRKDGTQPDQPTTDDDAGAPADDAATQDDTSTDDDASTDDAGTDDAGLDDEGGAWDPLVDAGIDPPADSDAGPGSDAGTAAGDPTAPIFQRYHFVKTGAHNTILTRDARNNTYQFKQVSSYCGTAGAKDCSMQKGATCTSDWTCTEKHTCSCGGN